MIESWMVCGFLALLVLLGGRSIQRRVKRVAIYSRRPAVPLDRIWRQHFALLGLDLDSCAESWLRLAATYRVDPTRLRATDRFDRELRNLDHLFDGWLLLTLTAAQQDVALRPRQIETVREFILLDARAPRYCLLPG